MSCNGCRVLRKGCSDSCILRSSLQSIESAEAQGHATVFVAKFFGRAGMMSLISAVDESQRPAVFQSLLYEACGRTVNPVHGAVGLLWSGNWAICQAAVDTVLKGGSLKPLPSHSSFGSPLLPLPSISPFLLPDALPPPPVFTNNKPSHPLPHSVADSHPFPKQRAKKRKLPSPSSDQQSHAISPHTIDTSSSPPPVAHEDDESQMRTSSDGRHSPPLAFEDQAAPISKHQHIDLPQLIAPVPRRIKPVMVTSQSSNIAADVMKATPPSVAKDQQPDSVKASLRTEKNHADDDRLLNLSLSLALDASKSPRIGSVRGNTVWSPCALSEGSVTTSLDSAAAAAAAVAELSIRSCAREAGHGERRPFLNLL